MKKITMLVSSKEKEPFLALLRQAGVIHIKHLANPSAMEVTANEDKISQAQKALIILSGIDSEKSKKTSSSLTENELLGKVQEIFSIQQEIDNLNKSIEDTQINMQWFSPWGKFSPKNILKLKEKGIYVKLYLLNKNDFNKLKNDKNIYLIKHDDGLFYIATVFYGQHQDLPFEEIKFPSETYEELTEKLKLQKKHLSEKENLLKEQIVFKTSLEEIIKHLQKKHNFLEVFYGMKDEEKFSLVQGFCPETEISKITALAKKHNVGYLIETPSPDEEPPTLIKNPKWLSIVNPVFEFINTLPGYAEFDISAVFLVFFSIFFAMIVGDAGYGTLFLIITFFARKKFKNVPAQPFHLMYVLSIATIIWGAISGTWFSFEQIAKLPIINSLVIEKVNSFADESQMFVMYLCFIIGVIHLTIGHTMKYIREMNSINSLAQLGWISILWGLFFLAGTLILNKPFPRFAPYLLIIGVPVVLIFSNFQKNILKGMALSLVDTFLGCTGGFSDIVSYLRLFAVGSASVAIASSFNSMAIGSGINSVLSGIIAAFIIFFAHALNITLSFLAVLVHGLRLNMLEFSGHLGMQWSGNKYNPFKE
jgi:V/A-type H+-transporting ATPase subunit I